jgi:hypothetical protein
MTLGGRESPEYRFVDVSILIFKEKDTKMTFYLFSDRFCGLICNATQRQERRRRDSSLVKLKFSFYFKTTQFIHPRPNN